MRWYIRKLILRAMSCQFDGHGILANAPAHDVYNEVLDLYEAGVAVSELRNRLDAYERVHFSDLEKELYLVALAKALCENRHPPKTPRIQLSKLVESGKSLAPWHTRATKHLSKSGKRYCLNYCTKSRYRIPSRDLERNIQSFAQNFIRSGVCLQRVAGEKIYRYVICKVNEYRGRCE